MASFPVLWQGSPAEMRELEALKCPRSVPWSFIEPHERQALRNHDQTLKRLAERGGLSPQELVAVVSGVGWRETHRMSNAEAAAKLRALLGAAQPPPPPPAKQQQE